jgi:hypothetical protein
MYELLILVQLQSVAFLRLLVASTDPLDIQIHGSRYHSIATHCIVLPVKFDGGLSMSVLRKKQLFTKKRGTKVYIFKKVQFSKTFQIPPFGKRTDQVPFFLDSTFLVNGIDNTPSNLTQTQRCFLSID